MDRNGSSKPHAVRNVRTFGDLIDLHDEDMHEVGKPPRRSKAAVMASLKTELGSVKLPALNRERLIEFGRKRAKQGAGPATLATFAQSNGIWRVGGRASAADCDSRLWTDLSS